MLRDIHLTSFQRSHGVGAPCFSAAVYQPKGYTFQKVEWCDIRQGDGTWIRPREYMQFDDPLRTYRLALWNHYDMRKHDILAWLERVGFEYHSAALLCWCPYDRAAQRQLEEFGSFVCHTTVIGQYLEHLGVRVWVDTDRLRANPLLP